MPTCSSSNLPLDTRDGVLGLSYTCFFSAVYLRHARTKHSEETAKPRRDNSDENNQLVLVHEVGSWAQTEHRV